MLSPPASSPGPTCTTCTASAPLTKWPSWRCLKSGIDTGVYGAVAAFGASFLCSPASSKGRW
ncbi:hypothetical protein LNQ03_14220 [Klebsiella pneumoniae subsp. pneumoniae]|nr:hypothetical protein [Klebsiella pneumoniae subsp. pneumoniae]